jgi:ectoine hydroxylase-related dioxygenase (phytanoyl-CoA dioxygenase family)
MPLDMVNDLAAELQPWADRVGGRGGMRNLLDMPGVQSVARSAAVRRVAQAVLGDGCVAVRGIFFDKAPTKNWKVPWHQDLTIAVCEARQVPGFGPWSEKAGVPHVHAPVEILERMLAVRLQLDDCGPENGPIRVLPGSHLAGKLRPAQIEEFRTRVLPVECVAPRGSILAFRPLLLHASSPATRPAHRRVVHLEFAVGPLPDGLQWRWSI